jgi:hypothetical protein
VTKVQQALMDKNCFRLSQTKILLLLLDNLLKVLLLFVYLGSGEMNANKSNGDV